MKKSKNTTYDLIPKKRTIIRFFGTYLSTKSLIIYKETHRSPEIRTESLVNTDKKLSQLLLRENHASVLIASESAFIKNSNDFL